MITMPRDLFANSPKVWKRNAKESDYQFTMDYLRVEWT